MKGLKGVFERPAGSNVWWIRYIDASGKERREKAGSKSIAIQLYRKRKQQALEGKKLPEKLRSRTVLFGELLDDAVEHVKNQAVPGKDGRYSCKVELIREPFGSVDASSITPQDISRWMARSLRQHSWRPATANRYKALISLSFRLGIENAKCTQNPARLVRRLRENNERVRFLSEDEEKRLRTAIQAECPEHMPDLDIALNTGMRKSEQFGLKWKDVDLDARRATLRETKNGSVRHVPLNTTALEAFKLLAQRNGKKGRVFGPEDGSHPVLEHRGWWESVLEKSGLVDFHWHDCRHHFASKAVMAGVDLRTLQQLLGHKTLQMVVRYSHLSQSHELAAVEKICVASIQLHAVVPGENSNGGAEKEASQPK
jgi:integrase